MHTIHRIVLAALATASLGALGCAYLKAVDHVEVYRSTRPARAFKEVGIVEGRRSDNDQMRPTAEQLEYRMKADAYHRGGDAVIDVREVADPAGNLYLTGTAIKYYDVPPATAQPATYAPPPPVQPASAPY